MANLINVERATVGYGTRTLLDAVSLGIEDGDAIGVVGRNGDGKTTILEILEGMREADSGTALIDGIDVARDPRRVKAKIGVQLQTPAFFDYLSVAETVRLYGELYGRTVDVDAILEQV